MGSDASAEGREEVEGSGTGGAAGSGCCLGPAVVGAGAGGAATGGGGWVWRKRPRAKLAMALMALHWMRPRETAHTVATSTATKAPARAARHFCEFMLLVLNENWRNKCRGQCSHV